MKKVYLESNGCSVVRHDSQRYAKYFRINGWQEIDSAKKADIVLFTTCGVIQDTENFAVQSIERMKKEMKSGAKLVIGGCLPKINPERVSKIFGGIIFSKTEENILDSIIDADISIKDIFWTGI